MKKTVAPLLFLTTSLLVDQSFTVPIDQLSTPSAIAGKSKWNRPMTRRSAVKKIAGGVAGTVFLTQTRSLSWLWAEGATVNSPEKSTPTSPEKPIVNSPSENLKPEILSSLIGDSIKNYYERIQELVSEQKKLEQEKLFSLEIARADWQLLTELREKLKETSLKESFPLGGFDILKALALLHEQLLAQGYWFDASQGIEIVGGRVVDRIWSFSLAKIAHHRKDQKEQFLEGTVDDEVLQETVWFNEVILDEILIAPFHEVESGKEAYAASWVRVVTNPDWNVILYDRQLLRGAGRALWSRLRSATPPDKVRQELRELRDLLAKKGYLGKEDKDYQRFGLLLSLALRQKEWGALVQTGSEEEFVKDYTDWMINRFHWGNAQALKDLAILKEFELHQGNETQSDIHSLIRELTMRRLLREMIEGGIPYEILAQLVAWRWGEPQESLLFDVANRLLGEIIPRVARQMKLAEQNDYTLLLVLPQLTEFQLEQIAQEILKARYIIRREKDQAPPKPEGMVPRGKSTDEWMGLAVLMAL